MPLHPPTVCRISHIAVSPPTKRGDSTALYLYDVEGRGSVLMMFAENRAEAVNLIDALHAAARQIERDLDKFEDDGAEVIPYRVTRDGVPVAEDFEEVAA